MRFHVIFIFTVIYSLVWAQFERPNNHVRAYVDSVSYHSISPDLHNIEMSLYNTYSKLRDQIYHCLYHVPSVGRHMKSPCGVIIQTTTKLRGEVYMYMIATHANTHVNMSVGELDLAESLHQCGIEQLRLDCGSSSYTYCGSRQLWEQHCMTNQINLTFTTKASQSMNTRHTTTPTTNITTTRFHLRYQILQGFEYQVSTMYYKLPHLQAGADTVRMVSGSSWDTEHHSNIGVTGNMIEVMTSPVGRYTMTYVSMVTSTLTLTTHTDIDYGCFLLDVHDGPSVTSPFAVVRVKTDRYQYSSSGFVLLLNIIVAKETCLRHPTLIKRLNMQLNISERHMKSKTLAITEHVDLNLNLSRTQNNGGVRETFLIDSMTIQSNSTLQVYLNVTVEDLEASGPTSDDCKHWGVVIYQMTRYQHCRLYVDKLVWYYQTLEPIFIVCKQILQTNGRMSPVPNMFISNVNKVAIVWFSYHTNRTPLRVKLAAEPNQCPGMYAYCGPPTVITMAKAIKNLMKWPSSYVYDKLPIVRKATSTAYDLTCPYRVITEFFTPSSTLCVFPGGRTSVNNALLPFLDIPCITFQHILHYKIYGEQAQSCRMSVWLRHPESGYLFSVKTWTIQEAFQSSKVISEQDDMSNYLVKFNPRHSAVSFSIAISQYPKILLTNFARTPVSQRYFLPVNIMREHYTRNLRYIISLQPTPMR